MNNRKSNGIVRDEKNLLHDSRIDSGNFVFFVFVFLFWFGSTFRPDAIYMIAKCLI